MNDIAKCWEKNFNLIQFQKKIVYKKAREKKFKHFGKKKFLQMVMLKTNSYSEEKIKWSVPNRSCNTNFGGILSTRHVARSWNMSPQYFLLCTNAAVILSLLRIPSQCTKNEFCSYLLHVAATCVCYITLRVISYIEKATLERFHKDKYSFDFTFL